jgi:hypothetical protein
MAGKRVSAINLIPGHIALPFAAAPCRAFAATRPRARMPTLLAG